MAQTGNVRTSLDQTYCVIFPKNFSTIYLFWRLSDFKINKFENKEYNEKLIVKIVDGSNNYLMETTVLWNVGKIYLNLPKDNFRCQVKIYAQTLSGGIEEIACSNFIDIPSEKEHSLHYNNSYKYMVKL